MLRYDLKRAGIPYQDASGQFFDFHSLRCQYATLLDAVGVSPRVVQTLMRHSSIDLTGRYTKPRTAHLDAAVEMLPSLKPIEALPQEAIMTGTDSTVTPAITDACNSKSAKTFTSLQARSAKPPSPVRIRAALSTSEPAWKRGSTIPSAFPVQSESSTHNHLIRPMHLDVPISGGKRRRLVTKMGADCYPMIEITAASPGRLGTAGPGF